MGRNKENINRKVNKKIDLRRKAENINRKVNKKIDLRRKAENINRKIKQNTQKRDTAAEWMRQEQRQKMGFEHKLNENVGDRIQSLQNESDFFDSLPDLDDL